MTIAAGICRVCCRKPHQKWFLGDAEESKYNKTSQKDKQLMTPDISRPETKQKMPIN